MNDSWYKILNKIKIETPKETIINSWWDFGDWYKVISERRVTFDAGSQQTPIAYWMAKFFLTDSEDQAIGILRMLNNGSNSAFEELVNSGLDKFRAMEILNRIIPLSRQEARDILKGSLKEDKIDFILDLTHKNPEVPSLVIVDSSLIDEIEAISYLGNWSYERLNIWFKFKSLKKADFESLKGYDQKEIESIYNEIRFLDEKGIPRWVSHIFRGYSKIGKGRREKDFIFFDNSLILNLLDRKAEILGRGIPKSVILVEGQEKKEITYEDANLDFSCLVFQDEDGYKSIFVDPGLAKSMITRLLFLKGKTLKHFRLLYEDKDDQPHIYVYKVIF